MLNGKHLELNFTKKAFLKATCIQSFSEIHLSTPKSVISKFFNSHNQKYCCKSILIQTFNIF